MGFGPVQAPLCCRVRALRAMFRISDFQNGASALVHLVLDWMDAHIVVARSCTHAQWHKGGQSVCSPSFRRHPSGPVLDFRDKGLVLFCYLGLGSIESAIGTWPRYLHTCSRM